MRDRNTAELGPKKVESLLYPIATFLHVGGMKKDDAIRALSLAFDRVLRAAAGRPMVRIGHPTPYADVVARWVRDERFHNVDGTPRLLKLNGHHGFATLVRSAPSKLNPKAVLQVLMRYGNVRRTKDGNYELVRPFFHTSSNRTMAYEPVAYFLSDASATLSQILKRSSKWRGPDLFWQKAESIRISDSKAKRFNAYAKERSLLFLDELDDWLEANSDRKSPPVARQRRVGIGIFSIYSDREPFRYEV